jgi:hypothetical protein
VVITPAEAEEANAAEAIAAVKRAATVRPRLRCILGGPFVLDDTS